MERFLEDYCIKDIQKCQEKKKNPAVFVEQFFVRAERDETDREFVEKIAEELKCYLIAKHQETQEESKTKVLSLKYSKTGRADQPQELYFGYHNLAAASLELIELAKEDLIFKEILTTAARVLNTHKYSFLFENAGELQSGEKAPFIVITEEPVNRLYLNGLTNELVSLLMFAFDKNPRLLEAARLAFLRLETDKILRRQKAREDEYRAKQQLKK